MRLHLPVLCGCQAFARFKDAGESNIANTLALHHVLQGLSECLFDVAQVKTALLLAGKAHERGFCVRHGHQHCTLVIGARDFIARLPCLHLAFEPTAAE